MPKILAKSGDSLADVYDVAGSIAGIDDLISKDVSLVHEMGGTIASERLRGNVVLLLTGDIAQNTTFNVSLSVGPRITRLLAMQVLVVPVARLTNVQVSITATALLGSNEVPIWCWDSTDSVRAIKILIGGSIADRTLLVPAVIPTIPNLAIGTNQPLPMGTISLRGRTSGFGAGTVETSLLLYTAFPELQGVSSRGLPIPGW